MNKSIKLLIESYFEDNDIINETVNATKLKDLTSVFSSIISTYYGKNILNICNNIIGDIQRNTSGKSLAVNISLNGQNVINTLAEAKTDAEDLPADSSDNTNIEKVNADTLNMSKTYIRRLLGTIAEAIVTNNTKLLTPTELENQAPDFWLHTGDYDIPCDVKLYNKDKIYGSLKAGSKINEELTKFKELLTQNNNDLKKTFLLATKDNTYVYITLLLLIIEFTENNLSYAVGTYMMVPLICLIPINYNKSIFSLSLNSNIHKESNPNIFETIIKTLLDSTSNILNKDIPKKNNKKENKSK